MSSRSLDDLHDDSDLDEYDDSDDDEELRLAQEEWDESVAQLQLLVSVVAMPWFGKWLGRRWSRWAYARYLQVGLSRAFFLGS